MPTLSKEFLVGFLLCAACCSVVLMLSEGGFRREGRPRPPTSSESSPSCGQLKEVIEKQSQLIEEQSQNLKARNELLNVLNTKLQKFIDSAHPQGPLVGAPPLPPPAMPVWEYDHIPATYLGGRTALNKWNNLKTFMRARNQPATQWARVMRHCRHKVFAQGMQDGILLCILAAISGGGRSKGRGDDGPGTTISGDSSNGRSDKYFVEFGHNNLFESNSGLLYVLGWDGLFLDGANNNSKYNSFSYMLHPKNIGSILQNHSVPKGFEYLSADLDSIELFVVEAIFAAGYRPKVWSIEYNCNLPFDKKITMPLDTDGWKGSCYFGLSLGAAMELATAWDYSLVAVEPALDAFFVANELLPRGFAPLKTNELRDFRCGLKEKSPYMPKNLHPCDVDPVAKLGPWFDVTGTFGTPETNLKRGGRGSSGGEESGDGGEKG